MYLQNMWRSIPNYTPIRFTIMWKMWTMPMAKIHARSIQDWMYPKTICPMWLQRKALSWQIHLWGMPSWLRSRSKQLPEMLETNLHRSILDPTCYWWVLLWCLWRLPMAKIHAKHCQKPMYRETISHLQLLEQKISWWIFMREMPRKPSLISSWPIQLLRANV